MPLARAGEPGEAQLRREFGRSPRRSCGSGPAGPRARRRSRAAPTISRSSSRALRAHRRRPLASRSRATPPGTTKSISSRWPNAVRVDAQHILAQPRELREAEREAAVVAELRRGRPGGWRRARARAAARAATAARGGARRRRSPPAPARRPRRRPPCCRRRRARRAVRLDEGQRLEALLDALVRVAQALLEAQHLLADDREAEMSGLDDAGVHRPDRDLVHAVAFDADERYSSWPGSHLGDASKSRRSGKRSIGQLAMPQPRPLVVGLGARCRSGRTRRAACGWPQGRSAARSG